jgi:hypothetical protein
LQPWFKGHDLSILDKRPHLKVTIYGPYGDFTRRLDWVAQKLRDHEFADTFLVKDRRDFRSKHPTEGHAEYFTQKSYYYLNNSDVNIFIFYCGPHAESAAMELQYICQKLRNKISCCAVMKDTACKMAMLLKGQIDITKISVDKFDGRNKNCDEDIARLVEARCYDFLKTKCYDTYKP